MTPLRHQYLSAEAVQSPWEPDHNDVLEDPPTRTEADTSGRLAVNLAGICHPCGVSSQGSLGVDGWTSNVQD